MDIRPLDLPEFDDNNSYEILRVWIEKTSQKYILLPQISDDPGEWGIILVDIARHVANAYAESEPENENTRSFVLDRIRQYFDAEWEYPTE